MKKKLNLNDPVRFKLTDHGKDIYYHQYDELNERKGKQVIKPHYPEVDDEGYVSMQLWSFIELYGPYIGLAKENVIEPLDLEFEVKEN